MCYHNLKLIIGYCLAQLLSLTAFCQQSINYQKLTETAALPTIFDEVYDFTYNPSIHAVGFLNRELFGLQIVSLHNSQIIFDNSKIPKNRLSVKNSNVIVSPFALQISNSGRFMFYDFTFNKRITRSNKTFHINTFLLKEIDIHEENQFTYYKQIPLSGLYLKSFIHSDSMIISNAVIDEENNTYRLNKRYLQKNLTDSIKLSSLSSLNMDGVNFWKHDIVKRNHDYIVYYYNQEQFYLIDSVGNVKKHTASLPHLDTTWQLDLETFDVFEPDYPIIKLFPMKNKIVFYYRSKALNEKYNYYLSVYNLETEKTEQIYQIPEKLNLHQNHPLPITPYNNNQMLLLKVMQGKYCFYVLDLKL